MADCPEVAEKLDEYLAMNVALHEAAPLRYPAPPAARILGSLEFADPPAQTTPDKVTPLKQPAARTPRRTWWIGVAALFVVTILAVGSNLVWFNRVNNLERALQTEATPRPTPPAPFSVMLRSEDAHHRLLLPTDAGLPDAQARVIWNSEIEVGVVVRDRAGTACAGHGLPVMGRA